MSAVPSIKLPAGVESAVALIRARGHVVTIRKNKNGDLRYSVDGRRETNALTMMRRYKVE